MFASRLAGAGACGGDGVQVGMDGLPTEPIKDLKVIQCLIVINGGCEVGDRPAGVRSVYF